MVVRRGLLLKALHRLVQDGQVIRTGTGQRADRYCYRVAANGERGNGAPPVWTAPQKRRNPIWEGKREGR